MMRRALAFTFAAATLLALPLAVASPAGANSSSLKLITLGRSGESVQAIQATATPVVFGSAYSLTSGVATTMPAGEYDVSVDIFEPTPYVDTLAIVRVRVSGATVVTLDARRGRLITLQLNPSLPTNYSDNMVVQECNNQTLASVLTLNTAGHIYLIPTSLAETEIAYGSHWSPPSGYETVYAASGEHSADAPNGITATVSQSSLTTVKITARAGTETGGAGFGYMDSSVNHDLCVAEVNGTIGTSATLPATVTAHLPPGTWSIQENGEDVITGAPRTYKAGSVYTVHANYAAWGPSGGLPYTYSDGRLWINSLSMFSDPVFASGAASSNTLRLSRDGTTIYSGTVGWEADPSPTIGTAGWYTLSESAVRSAHHLPSTILSPKSTVSLYFYANPSTTGQVRGLVGRFVPQGLDVNNAAAARASTTVLISAPTPVPRDPSMTPQADSVKSVRAWYSIDGGSTWHYLPVTGDGSGWKVVVNDPPSGAVSLRTQIVDTHGDTSTSTVYSAYAIH